MKQLFFLTLICTFSTFAKAQNTPFKVGFFINPNYCDRLETRDVFGQDVYVGQYAYSLGVFAQRKMTHSFNLRFGASLVNNGERTKRKPLWGSQNDNGGIEPMPAFRDGLQSVDNYYNIELPIDIQWFMNKKRTFFTIFGASPGYNYLKTVRTSQYRNDQLVASNLGEDKNDQGISVALQVGMGYKMRLKESLWLEINPKFKAYITRAQNSYSMYNIGLQTSIIF
jgi:hypothetical protein